VEPGQKVNFEIVNPEQRNSSLSQEIFWASVKELSLNEEIWPSQLGLRLAILDHI